MTRSLVRKLLQEDKNSLSKDLKETQEKSKDLGVI